MLRLCGAFCIVTKAFERPYHRFFIKQPRRQSVRLKLSVARKRFDNETSQEHQEQRENPSENGDRPHESHTNIFIELSDGYRQEPHSASLLGLNGGCGWVNENQFYMYRG